MLQPKKTKFRRPQKGTRREIGRKLRHYRFR